LRAVVRGARAVEIRGGSDLLRVVLLRALEVALHRDRRGARGVAVGEERLQRCRRALRRGGELFLVDLQQERTFLHPVALAPGEVDDLSHHVRGEVDLALRVDLAVRGDFAVEVLACDLCQGDGGDVFVPPRADHAEGNGSQEQYGNADQDLRSSFHLRFVYTLGRRRGYRCRACPTTSAGTWARWSRTPR